MISDIDLFTSLKFMPGHLIEQSSCYASMDVFGYSMSDGSHSRKKFWMKYKDKQWLREDLARRYYEMAGVSKILM